jgi:hypothetical protein
VAPFLNPSDFSAPDLPRLHVYVLPPLLPFVLLAADRVFEHWDDGAPSATTPNGLQVASLVATVAVAVAPFLLLDRYRRVDLRADGDAARVLATCRGTLLAAERLARGEEVEQRPVRAEADESGEPRLRWYLRDGWEAGEDVASMTGTRATLVVPARPPRDVETTIVLAGDADLRVSLDGRSVSPVRTADAVTVRLAADALVRGDNLLTLERDAGPAPQLRLLRIRPMP